MLTSRGSRTERLSARCETRDRETQRQWSLDSSAPMAYLPVVNVCEYIGIYWRIYFGEYMI